MPSRRDVGVVVVAAGQGRRAGGPDQPPKQFREVGGVPMLIRALRPFLARADVGLVVAALPAAAAREPPPWLTPLLGERLRVVAGGAERIDSVERGLEALGRELEVVLVHDGARPFPDPRVIDGVIAVARTGRGAVAALPVTDTLKEEQEAAAGPDRLVERTVSRDRLWRAQTPQAFPRALLERGLLLARATGRTATDDAQMVETLGEPVVLVPDVSRNLKVTSAADLALADALARSET